MVQVTYQTVLEKCIHPDTLLTRRVCEVLGISIPSLHCTYSKELSPEYEELYKILSNSAGQHKKHLANLLIQKSVSFYEALRTYEILYKEGFTPATGEAAFQNVLSKADDIYKCFAICYAAPMGTDHEIESVEKMIEVGSLSDWLDFYENYIPATDYGYFYSHLRKTAIAQIARLIKEEAEAQSS